jgi:hypothetical protein
LPFRVEQVTPPIPDQDPLFAEKPVTNAIRSAPPIDRRCMRPEMIEKSLK